LRPEVAERDDAAARREQGAPIQRAELAGHTHIVSAGAIADVPVWTGGAATYLMDALPPAQGGRALRAPTISRIDLFDGKHSVIP
jgi:hypothetical protein